MKPKTMTPTLTEPSKGGYDDCGTPPYALDALLSVIGGHVRDLCAWEPAVGEGLLLDALVKKGYTVLSRDADFFSIDERPEFARWLVTNPPYSNKYAWIEHALSFFIPVAMLMPVEAIGAKAFWDACTMVWDTGNTTINYPKIVYVTPRINFKMPNKGWSGAGAQFPTCWFLWNIHHIEPISVVHQTKKLRDTLMQEAGYV